MVHEARMASQDLLRKAAAQPERWGVILTKLCNGSVGWPESYGVRSFLAEFGPSISTEKANGDAVAPPSTD